MLADNSWIEVAQFAAYHCQTDTLWLLPWQKVPMDIVDPNAKGVDREAARLLKRMLACGVSRLYPDPVAATEDAQKL